MVYAPNASYSYAADGVWAVNANGMLNLMLENSNTKMMPNFRRRHELRSWVIVTSWHGTNLPAIKAGSSRYLAFGIIGIIGITHSYAMFPLNKIRFRDEPFPVRYQLLTSFIDTRSAGVFYLHMALPGHSTCSLEC